MEILNELKSGLGHAEEHFMAKIQGLEDVVYNASRAEGAVNLSLMAGRCTRNDFIRDESLGRKYNSKLFFSIDGVAATTYSRHAVLLK